MSRLVVDPGSLRAFLAGPHGPVARDLALRAQRVRDQAVVNASGRPGPKVQTGRLRSSLRWFFVTQGDFLFVLIGTSVEYARFVELGTGPYVIRPVNRQALSWPGADHPVAVVYRAGNRAYPFLRPAARAAYGSHTV